MKDKIQFVKTAAASQVSSERPEERLPGAVGLQHTIETTAHQEEVCQTNLVSGRTEKEVGAGAGDGVPVVGQGHKS